MRQPQHPRSAFLAENLTRQAPFGRRNVLEPASQPARRAEKTASDLRSRCRRNALLTSPYARSQNAPFVKQLSAICPVDRAGRGASAVSAQEFMNQRAVNIAVAGRYSLANWYDAQGNRREFACRTTRMSPFRMLVQVPVIGKVGERVVSYFGDFGTLDGWITDTVKGGFLVDLEAN